MATIPQISTAMQKLLGPKADELGIITGFTRRKRKLTGSSFTQTMVFSGMTVPELTYTQLCLGAMNAGIAISAQGLEQRFTPAAVRLLHKVLEATVSTVVSGVPADLELLSRFKGMYIRDSSVISLPKELSEVWSGVGNSNGETASIKLQVRLDYQSGQLAGPFLQAGRAHDTASPYHTEILPVGAIRMGDLGYFDLEQFGRDDQQGAYWLTRYKAHTVLCTQSGERLSLLDVLQSASQATWEMLVWVGEHRRLVARLLVQRVPQEVADQRRRKLKDYARKKQVAVSPETLALADWTLLLTNIPTERLSIREALTLVRIRWQIELLFRLWKSVFLIDTWRSHNPYRILTELFAKLIAVVIIHWTFLTEFWHYPDRSLWKAATIVQSLAPCLALSFHDLQAFQTTLYHIQHCFRQCCHMNIRRSSPHTYQLLLAVEDACDVQN